MQRGAAAGRPRTCTSRRFRRKRSGAIWPRASRLTRRARTQSRGARVATFRGSRAATSILWACRWRDCANLWRNLAGRKTQVRYNPQAQTGEEMASQRMNNHAVEVVFLFAMLAAFSGSVVGQNATASLAERLGYSRDAKLLIVHADDLGMTHAVNAASIQGLESGLVRSASMIVPCPWFPEIADYARNHRDADLGLHLTLTSERGYLRWGRVASKAKLPTFLDHAGYY